VQGVGVLLEVTGGQTYFNGAASNWVINRNEIGAAGGTTVYVPGGGGTVTNFDASTVLNQDLRFTGNLSGSAAFTGQNAAGSSLSVNASNTGLFNLLLPAGYSIVANPSQVPWLATPTLTAPVPEPRSTALFAAGLAIAGLVARRRTRQVLRR
jgi:hypothetical protein